MVLAHEIGHTLGIGHSDVPTAIMYPWYQKNITMLDEDDKMALESLYGPTQKFVHNPYNDKSTTTTMSTTTMQPTLHSTVTNICDIKSVDFMFLASTPSFPNFRLYIGFNRFLWKFDLFDIHIPLHSEYVKDYLPQKTQFEPISHIFQNSAGNLFAFNKLTGDCYTTSFPDLTILEINKVPIPTNSKVDVIFQTNSGQIFVFYDQAYYIEFNDGFKKILNRGRVSDRFLGLPKNPTAAFRYIDGYIYFFTQDTTTTTTYYKFSEYSRSVISSGPFDWNLFGIPWPNSSLKEQLKALLTRVLSIYE
ncbi:hatching enzyme-like [Diorhabda sublineata]|uniref:hatching enzyme-like n=1 Tax=Diorhabda sublineata TaxID=1163346 RepID=UPI0024E142E7|nr:hatching enzyme-like [Diorhabda sublineata]